MSLELPGIPLEISGKIGGSLPLVKQWISVVKQWLITK